MESISGMGETIRGDRPAWMRPGTVEGELKKQTKDMYKVLADLEALKPDPDILIRATGLTTIVKAELAKRFAEMKDEALLSELFSREI